MYCIGSVPTHQVTPRLGDSSHRPMFLGPQPIYLGIRCFGSQHTAFSSLQSILFDLPPTRFATAQYGDLQEAYDLEETHPTPDAESLSLLQGVVRLLAAVWRAQIKQMLQKNRVR